MIKVPAEYLGEFAPMDTRVGVTVLATGSCCLLKARAIAVIDKQRMS